MSKAVKCVYCGVDVPINPNGRLKPHILHKGKNCIGSGWKANLMGSQRKFIDEYGKSKGASTVGTATADRLRDKAKHKRR